jgi:hypothetical protein
MLQQGRCRNERDPVRRLSMDLLKREQRDACDYVVRQPSEVRIQNTYKARNHGWTMSLQLTTREKLQLWVASMKSSLLVERMSYRFATSAAAVALVTLAMNNTAGGETITQASAMTAIGPPVPLGLLLVWPFLALFRQSSTVCRRRLFVWKIRGAMST